MKDRYQEQWENLGLNDPYWAVLTDPSKKGGKWKKDEFFASGKHEIDQIMQKMSRLRMLPQFGTALDFGCGVGRLSRALAQYFKKVIGVDISRTMLEEAWAQNQGFSNIEFVHNVAPDLEVIRSASVDFVYSNIVLQHMLAERQLLYISEFSRVLRPGGIAIFQTPAKHDLRTFPGWVHSLAGNRLLNIARRIIYGKNGIMEMHTLPKDKVLTLLDKCGMSVVDAEENNASGKGFISCLYYTVKLT